VFKNLFIFFLLISVRSFAQLPANIGFEEGSFNHWNCTAGSIDLNGVITLNNTGPVATRHTLFSRANDSGVLDPYGNFPVLCPNGSNYSVRLGNEAHNHEAEGMTYTFLAPNQPNYSLVFNYAVVFQNPNHKYFEQPKFTARVYDITDDKYVDCPAFNFVASSDLPGFVLSATKAVTSIGNAKDVAIYYKPWATATINLTGYAGKLLRLEFTTNDCVFNAHFGYAYIDMDEGLSSSPITGNEICSTQQASMTLKAPEGFQSYIWYNEDLSSVLGTGQYFTTPSIPPEGTKYAVKVFPYVGLGCQDVLFTTIKKVDDGLTLKVIDTIRGCPETGVNLTDKTVTAGSSDGFIYNYFIDASLTTHVPNPTSVVLPGTYYIQAMVPLGCPHVSTVHVKLIPPIITVTQPSPAVYPATVDITKTFVKQDSFTYSYYTDASATIPLSNYTSISKSGSYYIKVKNTYGCELVTPVYVVCLPPPPYIVTGPNVFTPNNDGINDNFGMHIEGYVKFDDLSIFNRYGQLVFATKSQSATWDGKFSGRDLPVGTYYWIFNGVDTYYNVPIRKSGYISIIR
jgi:gliding motility-associated-like protein